jgi:lipopolysaccharide transport system ATP-binding protein
MNSAITVAGLSKVYRIRHRADRPTTAAEAIVDRVRHPLRRSEFENFVALDDVSFDVPWGQAMGIIGRNGAGKSTLLKILTRITAPSGGRIELGGRVGSLLEIGTGFHPELTGRENIYLNGTLLGMRRTEIRRRFDEIVAFSGVEKFLDTPVKRYSSGMQVRLGFSVAAHLETEILAIDEVLAVGDAEFQAKCIGKMREAASSGRAVLYVSHQMQTVTSLCTNALYLERGLLIMQGTVDEAMHTYRASFERVTVEYQDADRRPGSGQIRFSEVRIAKDVVESADDKVIEFALPASERIAGSYFVSCHINDANGVTVLQCDSRVLGEWFDPSREQRGAIIITAPWLRPGRYIVDLFACQVGILDGWEAAAGFDVLPSLPYPQATTDDAIAHGLVLADFRIER